MGMSQNSINVSGEILDASSGETLIGATVFAPEFQEGSITNEYGFFSIELNDVNQDSIRIEVSYVGYTNYVTTISGKVDSRLEIELSTGVALEEVVVKANSFQEQMRSTEMSVEKVTTKEVRMLPVLLGETDIIKTIQLKPGIPSGSEGTTGLYVRGGAI